MNDAEAFAFYDHPAKREPTAGPPRRRPDRPATQHVPVRFPTETIEQVKRIADADGMTVSAWIRRAVERALRQHGLADVEQVEGGDARSRRALPARCGRAGRRACALRLSLNAAKVMTIESEDGYRRTKAEVEKFTQAIAAARSRPPSTGVDPRIHEAEIEALESEFAVLRKQLDEYERRVSQP